MSFASWHNYGYGVRTTDIRDEEVTVERLRELLKLAPNFNSTITEWLKECEIEEPTVEDYYDFDQDYQLGLAYLIKEVISEAEGMELCACDDLEGYKFIMYSPKYPWNMNEKDLLLTEEALDEMFTKYLSIICDEIPDIDYQQCENGG